MSLRKKSPKLWPNPFFVKVSGRKFTQSCHPALRRTEYFSAPIRSQSNDLWICSHNASVVEGWSVFFRVK
jgi:hypothetical protein